MRKMEPKPSVKIRRKLQTTDGDALKPRLFGFDQDCPGRGYHPQYFKAQGRQNRALCLHQHRDPPDNAVALGLDREQAAPSSRFFQGMDVPQQTREIEEKTLRLLTEHG